MAEARHFQRSRRADLVAGVATWTGYLLGSCDRLSRIFASKYRSSLQGRHIG